MEYSGKSAAETPVWDFVCAYADRHGVRAHMPGHKGSFSKHPFGGISAFDITEIEGADVLCEAEGIIGHSQSVAASLFGSYATFYCTEGSTQCIRAMLHLAASLRKKGCAPYILAGRNVHKSFIYGAALLDIDVKWMRGAGYNPCMCNVTPESLLAYLEQSRETPAAVYITSPDYLGNIADIKGLSEICKSYGTRLLVDNAHGSYLHFLRPPAHPLDLGADICCDSAHKTLPALTGAAHLHIGRGEGAEILAKNARQALDMFCSTSPSYLILASLDICNAILADNFGQKLAGAIGHIDALKRNMEGMGVVVAESDPLRVTIRANGARLSSYLRDCGIECEYSDRDTLVMMLSCYNKTEDFYKINDAIAMAIKKHPEIFAKKHAASSYGAGGSSDAGIMPIESVMGLREAIFSKRERLPIAQAAGRILALPACICPPAVTPVMPGEKITPMAAGIMEYFGTAWVDVIKE